MVRKPSCEPKHKVFLITLCLALTKPVQSQISTSKPLYSNGKILEHWVLAKFFNRLSLIDEFIEEMIVVLMFIFGDSWVRQFIQDFCNCCR